MLIEVRTTKRAAKAATGECEERGGPWCASAVPSRSKPLSCSSKSWA